MTYLAEVTKEQQFNSKAIASLLGIKRPDGLWISVGRKEIVINNRDLNLKQLILLELDDDSNPLTIVTANSVLLDCLRDWSLRLTRFDSKNADIELTKESLEYQSMKLYERDQAMNRRDERQRIQEKKLVVLEELAHQKANAADRQHLALKEAWEHLNYKEQQLKKT